MCARVFSCYTHVHFGVCSRSWVGILRGISIHASSLTSGALVGSFTLCCFELLGICVFIYCVLFSCAPVFRCSVFPDSCLGAHRVLLCAGISGRDPFGCICGALFWLVYRGACVEATWPFDVCTCWIVGLSGMECGVAMCIQGGTRILAVFSP